MPGGRTWAVQLNTIILETCCGVCGVLGQEPNNSVYLAPTTGSRVSIACHCNLMLESWRTLHSSGHWLN